MEKTIKILSNGNQSTKEIALNIKLEIHNNPLNIPIDLLFTMAARKNPKRDFLFVSKLIGKHLPIRGEVLEITGAILARKWVSDRYSMDYDDIIHLIKGLEELLAYDLFEKPIKLDFNKEIIQKAIEVSKVKITLPVKTLFIGFAETATGMAQSVFNCFHNAQFINTTREVIPEIEPDFIFKEEHSHAVNHLIYSPSKNYFENFSEIVLVDDEITTGKTAINLIHNLPARSFGVISILDWRSEFHKLNSKDEDILFSSLLEGSVECTKLCDIITSPTLTTTGRSASYKHIPLSAKFSADCYVEFTGRFGLNSTDSAHIDSTLKSYGVSLKAMRSPGKCLCIGDCEFIYAPCLISKYMGHDVFFQSSTRSPVYALNKKSYGNRNKVAFSAPNSEVQNYLYNIPSEYYEDVFFFSEIKLNSSTYDELSSIFSMLGIKNINFVYFTKEAVDE